MLKPLLKKIRNMFNKTEGTFNKAELKGSWIADDNSITRMNQTEWVTLVRLPQERQMWLPSKPHLVSTYVPTGPPTTSLGLSHINVELKARWFPCLALPAKQLTEVSFVDSRYCDVCGNKSKWNVCWSEWEVTNWNAWTRTRANSCICS